MDKFLNLDNLYSLLQGMMIGIFTSCVVFLDSTFSYLIALLLGFTFNILAGFRADEVKIKLHRLFPPIVAFEKFNGNKFKDSLLEFVLITSITYLLKGLMVLMDYGSQSTYVVQWLFAVAIYVYFRNGLRNLKSVYIHVKFIRILYALVSFKFREFFGDEIADIVKEEEEKKEEKEDGKL